MIASQGRAVSVHDSFPVSEGHALIVPRAHVASVYDLSDEEQGDLWKLVGVVRRILLERQRPDGFTLGVNDGVAAGQTVGRAHIHVIPRLLGDCPDLRG